MTPSATRVLVLAASGALMLGATVTHACERTKSAVASACSPKSTTVAAAPAKVSTDKSCAAPSAVTAKKAGKKAVPVAAAKKTAPAVAGMRVQRDPETGDLVPASKSLVADGLPVMDEMPSDLPQVALPGGGYMVDLQGYMQEYATLQIDAKGHRHFKCTSHPRATLKAPPVAPVTVDRSEK